MKQKFKPGVITGYKATNKDMKCHGFQYKLGVWHKHKGNLKICNSGFHFCTHPSGPWNYYNITGTRLFKIEARKVLDTPTEPGTTNKFVAAEIKFIEEIFPVGVRNDGDRNAGSYNTGDFNAGSYNTGDFNAGDRNAGNHNTGDCNTGDCNTGDCNAGDHNAGDHNAGDHNAGDCNTGACNAGSYNTGDFNSGNYNATNYSSGFFCYEEPEVLCFNLPTGLKTYEFTNKYNNEIEYLSRYLQGASVSIGMFKNLPNFSQSRLRALLKKYKT